MAQKARKGLSTLHRQERQNSHWDFLGINLLSHYERWQGMGRRWEAFENLSPKSLDLVIGNVKQRFPGRRQRLTNNNFKYAIENLRRLSWEILDNYYSHGQGQFKQFLGHDFDTSTLTSSDLFVGHLVISAWIDGLANEELGDRWAKKLAKLEASLTEACETAQRVDCSFRAINHR